MSAPFGRFALTMDDITKLMRGTFETFIDPGQEQELHAGRCGVERLFGVLHAKPSFLEYQRSLEQAHGENNARTLFGLHEIPSDNQIRTLPDPTPPGMVKPIYSSLFNALRESGVVDSHRSLNGTLLLAFDGTEYFSCWKASTGLPRSQKRDEFATVKTGFGAGSEAPRDSAPKNRRFVYKGMRDDVKRP